MKLHPLNQNFVWQQPARPFTCISDTQAEAYATQGGFVLPDVFSPMELTTLLAELDPLEAEKNALLKHVGPTQYCIHLKPRGWLVIPLCRPWLKIL